jgi:hypothetical protein
MKRTFTLIALLGLLVGTMLTGCNQAGTEADDATTAPVDTNAASGTVTN